ncbi:hypothetical protein [Dickeya chrysanthemi]|uniref:hypothetical protein n=1 Tax=Dickeya chrysanthemi TaxID=556 RepID=UPI00039CFF64|nr:hypothetical protein [Dickeya chrysanthemi]
MNLSHVLFRALFTLILSLFTGVALADNTDQLTQSLAQKMGVPEKYRQTSLVQVIPFTQYPESKLVFNLYNGIAFDDHGTSLPFAMFLSLTPAETLEKFYDKQLPGFHKIRHGDSTLWFADLWFSDEVKTVVNFPMDHIDKVWVALEPFAVDGVNVMLVKMNYRLAKK